MKIINIILTSQNGGAEQVFIDYMKVLRDNLGHQIMAVIKDDAPYKKQLEELKIEYKTIKNYFSYHDIFASKNLKKIITQYDADALIAHSGKASIISKRALKSIKEKKIFFITVNHSMNVKRSIGADIVLSVNKAIFYKTIDRGQPYDRSFVIANALEINMKDFVELPIDLSDKSVITLGVIGRMDNHIKAFDKAIKIIEILKSKKDKRFILKIAGDGKEKKKLLQLVKSLNLQDRVEFLGWVKNKKEFYDSIDIFVLPSIRETFGLVLLEAMKYGKPIISSAADGPKEIIRDQIDGILIDIKPQEEFENKAVQSILKLVDDKNFLSNLIKNSQKRLYDKFSFEALAKSLAEIFGKEKNNVI